MFGYCVSRDGSLGFGLTDDEAVNDAYTNKCRCNLRADNENRFGARVKELSLWLPTDYMLHISGVGCLTFKNGFLVDLRSNRKVMVEDGANVYYYCAQLFGPLLSYTDITCVLGQQLEKYVQGYSRRLIAVSNLPIVQVVNQGNDFNPDVIYTFGQSFIVGVSEHMLGVKGLDDEAYYVVPINRRDEIRFLLPYLGYRANYIISERSWE